MGDVVSAIKTVFSPYAAVWLLTALWVLMYIPQHGASEGALLELTRLTARTSIFFFLAAFSASALLKLTRSGAARWLVANRRRLGLAFALAHFIHLAVLSAYFVVSAKKPAAATLIVGGAAYVFIGLMALTSTNAWQRRLGGTWRRLHVAGSWFVWLVFLNSYVGRVIERREPIWLFGGITALMLAAAVLRFVVWSRARLSARASTPSRPA